jgi:phosphoribosyl-ATP pyrophosphohydrolase/phosphoribosyl-AMP cyclohydrolase
MRLRSAPLTSADLDSLAWKKMDGLIPAVVQNRRTGEVLMLGYMSEAALEETLASGLVTFFSRSRQRLWQKGESSGNRLELGGVYADCDNDALLVLADPQGPVCHLGSDSCFEAPATGPGWLGELSALIGERAGSGDESSYTRKLLAAGMGRVAQKIGEEGVEVALAAVSLDTHSCVEEVADLLYHLCVLMEARAFDWADVIGCLRERHSRALK